MDIAVVLGALVVLALIFAIGGGFVAARLLSHVAAQSTRGADSRDR
jgi:hypothetical protein